MFSDGERLAGPLEVAPEPSRLRLGVRLAIEGSSHIAVPALAEIRVIIGSHRIAGTVDARRLVARINGVPAAGLRHLVAAIERRCLLSGITRGLSRERQTGGAYKCRGNGDETTDHGTNLFL